MAFDLGLMASPLPPKRMLTSTAFAGLANHESVATVLATVLAAYHDGDSVSCVFIVPFLAKYF